MMIRMSGRRSAGIWLSPGDVGRRLADTGFGAGRLQGGGVGEQLTRIGLLRVGKHLPGVGLIPAPIQVLSRQAKLDDKVGREVLRRDFASLLSPKPKECSFVFAHNDPRVRPADEVAAVRGLDPDRA